jgi:hypothetical protein
MTTLAGCALLGPSGGPYPAVCEQLDFPARQCAAIVARALSNADLRAEDVASIEILPPPINGAATLGRGMIARVRFELKAGTEVTAEIRCFGILGGGDACNEDPTIGIAGGVDHDVPCTGAGEPPNGCATLPPPARPAVQALARPLRIEALDIPIDHLGRYEIDVGEAGLPDGILSRRSASLADPRPEAFWIDEPIMLEVRPLDPSRPPIGSIYRDPFDGVEPVKVYLVFDVTEWTPGAVLRVRDLIVE